MESMDSEFGSFGGAAAAMEKAVFYGWLSKKSGSKKSGTRRRSIGGLLKKWDKRWFVISTNEDDTYSVRYYKTDTADEPQGEFSLTGAKLQMFDGQYQLTFPPSEDMKGLHELQIGPDKNDNLTNICRFCEACTDFGVVMGELNLDTEPCPPGWEPTEITLKHEGTGSIGILLAGTNKTATVQEVIPGGAAAAQEDIVTGLRLRSINGKSIEGWSFQMVTQRIKDAPRPIAIVFTTPPPELSVADLAVGYDKDFEYGSDDSDAEEVKKTGFDKDYESGSSDNEEDLE